MVHIKVKELIEKLLTCDQNKEIFLEYDLGYGKANCDIVIELDDKVVITEEV